MPTPTLLSSGVAGLSTLATRDLEPLWTQVETAMQARDALRDVLPAVVEKYGSAAATLAADWYDNLREELAVKGSFTAVTADLGDLGTDSLAGWGVAPLFRDEPDWATARTLIDGGLQRRIANSARDTVTGSSVADPQATGWKRTGIGRCSFCRMLIGRGAVYIEATAKFKSHDHCGCGAAPAWKPAALIAA